MAEVELGSETEAFEKPGFIGPEVTGDKHFYNSYMLANPYSAWRQLVMRNTDEYGTPSAELTQSSILPTKNFQFV